MKLNFLLFFLMISMISFSQYGDFDDVSSDEPSETTPTWVNITVKGGAGTSLFRNHNFVNDNNIDYGYMNLGYSYGTQIGVNFGNGTGVAVEFAIANLKQTYDIKAPINYTKDVYMKSFDKYLLLRGVGETGTYFEVGMKMMKVFRYSEDNNPLAHYENSIESFSDKQSFGMVAGFGIGVLSSPVYDITFGTRFGFVISDIMDGEHYLIEDGTYENTYGSYSTTQPMTLDLYLSLSWHVGQKVEE